MARLYDATVEAAAEKGVDFCPSCFSADVGTKGTREKAGVKVRAFKCDLIAAVRAFRYEV